jgi:hypothetical protein
MSKRSQHSGLFKAILFDEDSNVKQVSCMLAGRLSNEQLKFKSGEVLFRVYMTNKVLLH